MATQTFPSQVRAAQERIIGPMTIPANPKSARLQANIDPADAANPANTLELVCETSSDGFVNDIHMDARCYWAGGTLIKGVLWKDPMLFVTSGPTHVGKEVRFRVTNNNTMTFGGSLTVDAAA